MKLALLPGLFLLSSALLSSLPAAQQVLPAGGRVVQRKAAGSSEARPVVHVVYDVSSDRIRSVRELAPGEQRLGTTPCFDNSTIWLLDTYVVTNPGEELLNWGFKNCPGASRLRSITLLYLSTAVSPSAGGPGGTLSFALYSGTRGFGNVGNEIFRRTFFGLPSSHLVTPIVYLTIDFGIDPLPLADGRIGWGFVQLDGDTGPVLVTAPNAAIQTIDGMDIYSPGPASAASYVGTFHYSAFCSCANTFIQLDEIRHDEVAVANVLNGSGVNPEILEQVFPARIGRTWAARVDVVHPPGATTPPFTILMCSRAPIAPLASRFGELLVDRSQYVVAPIPDEGSYAFAIPPSQGLVGAEVFVQAVVLPPVVPSVILTNALRVRFGY